MTTASQEPAEKPHGGAEAGGRCVLVTGGAGCIGSHAVLELLDSGFQVVVLDNLVTGFRWAIDPRAAFVEGGVEDDALVRRLLRDHDVCGILHFAGSTIAPESVRDPLKYYRNNTVASRSLLESVVAARVRHFVFSSTAAVYGPPGLDPVSEDSALQPATPYGWSKLEKLFAWPRLSHVLNCGYGLGHSVLEVLDMVGQTAGRPIPRRLGLRRPGDVDCVVADNRHLKERLAWRPRYEDLRVIITDALRWEERKSNL